MNNLLSVKQVAFILKVHPLTIRRYINEKRLKAVKVGGNVRIDENELQNFHKEVTPANRPKNSVFKSSKLADKKFSDEDPFLRLKGRGASLKLS
jgi:excisionase family DNA binding protein